MIELLIIPISGLCNWLRGRSYDKVFKHREVGYRLVDGEMVRFDTGDQSGYLKWWHPYFNFLTSKGLTSLYLSLAFIRIKFGLITEDNPWEIERVYFFLAVWLGTWLWAVFGWGAFYTFKRGKELENMVGRWAKQSRGLSEYLGAFSYTISSRFESLQIWATIAMSLRGLLILPMYGALTYLTGNLYFLAIGVAVGLLQGVCYWSVGEIKGIHETKDSRDKRVPYSEILTGVVQGIGLTFI